MQKQKNSFKSTQLQKNFRLNQAKFGKKRMGSNGASEKIAIL